MTIEFVAQITNAVGAENYQNSVYTVTSEANTSITQYDELAHPDEDVTVLDANDGIVEGYIFEDINGNDIYDTGDIPISGVDINISNGTIYYIAVTDGNGYFFRDVAAENWTILH